MKILPILPVIFLTGAAHAVNLPSVSCYTACSGGSISNGTISCRQPRYTYPNCINECICGDKESGVFFQYQCTCNSGYYSSTRSWSLTQCTCEKCNVSNGTCSDGGGITCNKGYYLDGTSCKQCPSSGGIYGTTSGTGATSITDCYIPSGTSFSDSYGSGTYTGDCYYSN